MPTTDSWPGGVEARAIEKADAEAWAELLAAVEKVDQTGENYDADDLLEELADPKLDAARDTVGLWGDGAMVGYGSVRAPDHVVDVHRVRTEGAVNPQWRGRGLGDGLVTWLTERGRAVHHERQPGSAGEINTGAISSNTSALALLAGRSYEPCRYFFQMERLLDGEPVPASPAAGRVRPVVRRGSAADAQRGLPRPLGLVAKDPETWKTWCTGARAFRAGLSYLVLDGERIAAYALGYEYVTDTAATGIQEVYVGQVGTRREYRGKGAAAAALAEVMTVAGRTGFQRALLGVDADNPTGALGLYERLGYRTKSQWITHRLPID